VGKVGNPVGRIISDQLAAHIAREVRKFQGPTSHSVKGISARVGRVVITPRRWRSPKIEFYPEG